MKWDVQFKRPFTRSIRIDAATMLEILLSLKTMELQTHFQVTPLFSMITASVASLQSSRLVDAHAL